MRGAPPDWVQKQLGHESLWTTLRYYAHWIPKESSGKYAELLEQRPITPGKSVEVASVSTISAPKLF
jgi:integrase